MWSSNQNTDPFGFMKTCAEVSQWWLTHPKELAETSQKYWEDLGAIHLTVWQRWLGGNASDPVPPHQRDERFQETAWTENLWFDLLKEYYLLNTRWLEDAIYETPELPEKTVRKAAFWTRQVMNAVSPSNFLATNPAALNQTLESGGTNLLNGMRNWLEDVARGDNQIKMVDSDSFKVGKTLATTPGNVVYRNDLIELIQYTPTTPEVHAIPLVIVPPWINKFYILDLNEKKSLIRYLVSQGFTVFMISWKNPTEAMRHTTFEDYMFQGAYQAFEVAREICQAPQVHPVGYCIGGTLLSALMAWLNQKTETEHNETVPVTDWTLFTSLVDFSNPGDVEVFIDEESLDHIDAEMERDGFLDGNAMVTSFRMLRSNSLIWRYFVHNYLYGETPPALDLLYWNIDNTRMPQAMHSFYLREMYLHNRLAQPNGLTLGDRAIDLGKIQQPLYIISAEQDHITPWKSTFEICHLVQGPVQFVLSTSGHIAGVVNPPVDPPKRKFWTGSAEGHTDAEAWKASQTQHRGSWWEHWVEWLRPKCGAPQAHPSMGNAQHPVLTAAPGSYVME